MQIVIYSNRSDIYLITERIIMDKIQEAIKEGCKDCPKAANEVPCMWGGFVGDCPYNTYKSEPEPGEFTKELIKLGGYLSVEHNDNYGQSVCERACNEIDRLTAEIAALNAELTCEECEQSFNDPESGVTALCMTCWNNIVTKLRGEIDLLTAENYKMRDGLEIGKSVLVLLDKALAEIKELEAENAKLKENNRFFEDLVIKMEQEIKALKG